MRRTWFLALLVLCSSFYNAVYAQTISGEVFDKTTQAPVPGANVLTDKSKKGAVTSLEGKFTIELSQGDQFIEVSHTGYKTQRIAVVTGTTSYKIELETSSSSALDQVVVVAYGTQKKANLTGAVA